MSHVRRRLIIPTGGIQVFDGLAALAGVSSRANAARPAFAPVAPATAPRSRQQDRVELSPEARLGGQLSEQEQKELDELRTRDREVRLHEQAHKAAAGPHGGPISFSFTTGPDGKRYVVEGEVPIDVSPVEGDPEATIRKMQQIRAAALAPADPSAADRQVAARAQQIEREMQAEQVQQEKDEQPEPAPQIDVLA